MESEPWGVERTRSDAGILLFYEDEALREMMESFLESMGFRLSFVTGSLGELTDFVNRDEVAIVVTNENVLKYIKRNGSQIKPIIVFEHHSSDYPLVIAPETQKGLFVYKGKEIIGLSNFIPKSVREYYGEGADLSLRTCT